VKILETAARRTILGVLLLLLKELKHLTRVLEIGVDSFRLAHGQRAQFTVAADESTEPADPNADRTIPRYENDEPEFLRRDLLEHLAREHHIAFDDSTDLVQVGKELGWLTSSGEFAQLPTGYGE
jgi:hypothetical protein